MQSSESASGHPASDRHPHTLLFPSYNKRIVEETLKGLYISIDPEEMYLVSKDANNRMEIVDGKVTSAKGGTGLPRYEPGISCDA